MYATDPKAMADAKARLSPYEFSQFEDYCHKRLMQDRARARRLKKQRGIKPRKGHF